VSPALLVIAKAPRAGRVKTRLCPPLRPAEAAAVARGALEDTLAAVAAARLADRRVLALDGPCGGWLPAGFEVVAQRGVGLAERLAAAFADTGGPALLVGMDTPQVTPALLDAGLAALAGGARSVFGPASDGGYWAIGLQAPDARVFAGIPMSTRHTGAAQRARLHELGLDPHELPQLMDVDTYDDARSVAEVVPTGRFAAALRRYSAAETANITPVASSQRSR
jgi:rSAM/selenodomain-associated transferase 1